MKKLLTLQFVAFAVLLAGCAGQNVAVGSSKENFDSDWYFRLESESHFSQVNLPHDWSADLPFDDFEGAVATGHKRGGTGYYEKTFYVPEADSAMSKTLYFEGVYRNAEVSVNGELLAFHPYGYTSFKVDFTEVCRFGDFNTVEVKVSNNGINSRWYSGSGIYRHVWLETEPRRHLDLWDIAVRTAVLPSGKASVEVVSGDMRPEEIKVSIFDISGRRVASGDNVLEIKNPRLWSPDTPYLYTAEISLVEDGRVTDVKRQRFGIRELHFSAEKGFLLNGEPVLLKGGCVHHDCGLLGSASFDAAEYRKVRLLKENGFNAVRCAHNPPSEAFLNACDEIGLFVVDEAFDQWKRAKNPDDYHLDFEEWSSSDIVSMVRRDRNHPCVIMWSIGNEIADRSSEEGVETARRLRGLILSLDTTRPVTAAVNDYWDNPDMNWKDNSPAAFSNLDVCGYNYMWWEYEGDMAAYPERIVYGSESTAMERAVNWSFVENDAAVIGDFIWTAIDYLGESGIAHAEYIPEDSEGTPQFLDTPWFNGWCGDIDICGNKKPQAAMRDVLWDNAAITMLVHGPVPAGKKEAVSYWGWPDEEQSWTWDVPQGDSLRVRVFTKAPEIRISLNGKELETRVSKGVATDFMIPYIPGTLEAVALEGGKETGRTSLHTCGGPERLVLSPDKTEFKDIQDLIYVPVTLLDSEGRVAERNDLGLDIEISGPGTVAAGGNASPVDMESFRSMTPATFRGKALVVVRPTGENGTVRLKVSSSCGSDEVHLGCSFPTARRTAECGNYPARGFERPFVLFNNWSAYDELSDNVPLTEELGMMLLDKVLEMKKEGVRIDGYMMDAFWFDREGGYRVWDRDRWPEGPAKWVKKCLDNGIVPGLWFSTNLVMSGGEYLVRPVEKWKGSETSDPAVMSLFEGEYLQDLMDVMQMYADMGFGIFKFDFAYFDAASDRAKAVMSKESIEEANKEAFFCALADFRRRNPQVKLIAYNGFGGDMEDTVREFRRTVDHRWLAVFDTMYSGDPRFSDVPMHSIWRSADLYSDFMVRQFLFNGVPASRIDDCSVMMGKTGTCYRRGTAAWKSSIILNMARPGRLNVIHGSIDLLDRDDAKWLAKAQKLFLPFQNAGRIVVSGGNPGKAQVYGYRASDDNGSVLTFVNPSQEFRTVETGPGGRILFTDSGFVPSLKDGILTLGPEQMAVVGMGRYADGRYDLGLEEDVVIASSVREIDFSGYVPKDGETIRIVVQIQDDNGNNYRTWGTGGTMGEYIRIGASDGDGEIPLVKDYDRVIWSGISWGEVELKGRGKPVTVDCKIDYFGTEVPCTIKAYSIE